MELTRKSKITGVTFSDNGVSRQDNVKALQMNQEIFAVHEADNAFDPNAIKLYADAEHTKPLGYLMRDLARDLVTQSKLGWAYTYFAEPTGSEQKVFGCNITIVAKKDD